MGAVVVNADQLKAAAKRLQAIEKPLTEATEKVANELEPRWKSMVSSNASTRLEQRVIGSTARAVPIENGIRLEAGKGGGSLSGGLSVTKAAGPVEYGANRAKRKTYKRRGRKRGVHNVTRRTAVQFKGFNKTGYVFAPAVKAFLPKLREGWFEGLRVVVSDTIDGS